MLFPDAQPWQLIHDGDQRAAALFRRHYSYRHRDNPSPLFVGPGQKLVLLTTCERALFVWRKFIDDSGQTGVNCAVFRNESGHKSSFLILEAEKIAHKRWPGERLYTFVNASKVRSVNPGYCFKMAGWIPCGSTQSGLVILYKPSK